MKQFLASVVLIAASAVLAPQSHSALLQISTSGSFQEVSSDNPVDIIQSDVEFKLSVEIDTNSLDIIGQVDNRIRYRGLRSVLTIDGQLIPTTVNSSIYLLNDWAIQEQDYDVVILTAAFIWAGTGYSIGTTAVISNNSFELSEIIAGDPFPFLSTSTTLISSSSVDEFWNMSVPIGSLAEVTPIPLPGAIWLLITALIGLGGARRRIHS